jgi:CheY-like chemotaxis protein
MSPSTPQRILVIDDDLAIIGHLQDTLQFVGHYQVLTATDGALGLEACFAQRPDCIIVDVRMPNLNGYQFILALRGDPQTQHIPIIILSALIQDADEEAGAFVGADAYLRKPVALDELLDTVQRVMLLSTQQRESRIQQLAEQAEKRGQL